MKSDIKKEIKVFLGGTCNESTWREELISKLDIEYFNPVVEDWTQECMDEEIRQREACDYVLYTITPAMMGVYSIAEVIDDSNKRPDKTIFCVLTDCRDGHFGIGQTKSLFATGAMVERNGGRFFYRLDDVAAFLNSVAIC